MTISNFRVVVLGMGVQGNKRARYASNDLLATVDIDKNNLNADFNNLKDINDKDYNAVLLCTPDNVKFKILKNILNNKKHVLVEKPLFVKSEEELLELQNIANKNKVVLYTAYNHRFEPHFINMKKLIINKNLGKIFRLRMFYGNGTSGLVKQSEWRDQGHGVVLDIGSHLLDTLIFWFGDKKIDIKYSNNFCFENLSPDHAILTGNIDNIFIELEVSLLSWKNDFTCDVIGDKGSAHISSLCKWGPSKFITRKRVLPAGKPDENISTLIQADPTWEHEYIYFKKLIKNKVATNLSSDIKIFNILKNSI